MIGQACLILCMMASHLLKFHFFRDNLGNWADGNRLLGLLLGY